MRPCSGKPVRAAFEPGHAQKTYIPSGARVFRACPWSIRLCLRQTSLAVPCCRSPSGLSVQRAVTARGQCLEALAEHASAGVRWDITRTAGGGTVGGALGKQPSAGEGPVQSVVAYARLDGEIWFLSVEILPIIHFRRQPVAIWTTDKSSIHV